MMMQHDKADDWVLATGETYTVEDYAREAFKTVGLDWSEYIETSEQYFRPNEVNNLIGNANKAKKLLKWKPKIDIRHLIKEMIDSDLENIRKSQLK